MSEKALSNETPKIRIRGLYKRFGTKQVLAGVDLDVPRGTSLVVIGGSGSGKSVLLKCILGLLEPDDGIDEIDGRDLLKLSREERELARTRIGMLFQAGALFDSLPVWENVAFGLMASRKATRATARVQADHFLQQVGLAASVGDLSPAELSGGMQKRVALARAIASQPDIMFFDEPTTGLDPIMGAVIDGLVVDCVKRLGSTAIAITHDMASARRIGDQAAMLLNGRIIWAGPADRLMDSGNAEVDQFTHGRREGPIQMELPTLKRPLCLLAAFLLMPLTAHAGAADELVGLFMQGCLPFAGHPSALRDWAQRLGLPPVPEQARAGVPARRARPSIDASAAEVKLALLSSDDGICSAVTDHAMQPQVTEALETGLREAGLTFRLVIERDDKQITAIHDREYLAAKDKLSWRILRSHRKGRSRRRSHADRRAGVIAARQRLPTWPFDLYSERHQTGAATRPPGIGTRHPGRRGKTKRQARHDPGSQKPETLSLQRVAIPTGHFHRLDRNTERRAQAVHQRRVHPPTPADQPTLGPLRKHRGRHRGDRERHQRRRPIGGRQPGQPARRQCAAKIQSIQRFRRRHRRNMDAPSTAPTRSGPPGRPWPTLRPHRRPGRYAGTPSHPAARSRVRYRTPATTRLRPSHVTFATPPIFRTASGLGNSAASAAW